MARTLPPPSKGAAPFARAMPAPGELLREELDRFARVAIISGRMLMILTVCVVIGVPWVLGTIGLITAVLQ